MPSKYQQWFKLIASTIYYAFQRLGLLVRAKIHLYTYKATPDQRNVVVVGGNFAGYFLAKGLAESLPTGWRVILIEKNSHFLFTWNFPRSTVVSVEHTAFIPFPEKPASAPSGIFALKHAKVVAIDENSVTLEDGEKIEFEYLAIATGSDSQYPAKLTSTSNEESMEFFRERQRRIRAGNHLVVVGGGAAGYEVATDTKSKYPEKTVTLVHSRDRLLNNFGPGLHDEAIKAAEDLGVKVYLNDRVMEGLDEDAPTEVVLKSGTKIACDTLVKATGQSPASNLVKEFSPSSIGPSGGILVKKNFQILNLPSGKNNILAVGDVIEVPGPKLGRAAIAQGMLAAQNIVRSIQGKKTIDYQPSMVDASIELTLGLGKNVMYINDNGSELKIPRKMHNNALHADIAWRLMDAKLAENGERLPTPKEVAV